MTNDFKLLKVIGKGGFSKVYMGKSFKLLFYWGLFEFLNKLPNKQRFIVRKKDTGFIYAMKVMKKDQVTNESKLK